MLVATPGQRPARRQALVALQSAATGPPGRKPHSRVAPARAPASPEPRMLVGLLVFIELAQLHATANAAADGPSDVPAGRVPCRTPRAAPGFVESVSDAFDAIDPRNEPPKMLGSLAALECAHLCEGAARAWVDTSAWMRPPSSRWRGGCPSSNGSYLGRSSPHCSRGQSGRASDRGRDAEAAGKRRGRYFGNATANLLERAAAGAAATRDSLPRALPRRRATLPSSAATARPPGARWRAVCAAGAAAGADWASRSLRA